ncbi:HNH endonuclease [Calothrix sp. PCC 7507]|uniref:HNH endonuclease n=1 Tax=Calothrix sp. PCC 7507 TaxID=99598 RepID=UPI00029F3A08|nr:HNH endonuclease signature motif containing protein [Calothrix sp. PCC 7507]AFY32971.1 HNH endonuclease [Calothrix sp. PCC 7507]
MSESRVTVQQKKAVAERVKGCCEYCRSQACFAIQAFSVEHIIPRSQGGKTNLDNLALSCQGFNNHKYNKTEAKDLVSGNIVSLYHPRQQRWLEHFPWNDDFNKFNTKVWLIWQSKNYVIKILLENSSLLPRQQAGTMDSNYQFG